MFAELESRIRSNSTGMVDFEVESLNALDMIRVRRLVFMLKRLAIQCRLKIVFTDFYGAHYHLEWSPDEVPSVEFRWPIRKD